MSPKMQPQSDSREELKGVKNFLQACHSGPNFLQSILVEPIRAKHSLISFPITLIEAQG